MKKVALTLVLLTFVALMSSAAYADKYEIGADVAIKVQYFRFTDSTLGDLNLENGIYVGVEAYKQLFVPNLYFGVEAGWAGTNSSPNSVYGELVPNNVDVDVNYIPIEFNAKYVIPIQPSLKLSLGGGFSYNYFKMNVDVFNYSTSGDDWVFGGQFFAALDYQFCNNAFLGVEAKYQLTENLNLHTSGRSFSTDTSADNFRVGLNLGYRF